MQKISPEELTEIIMQNKEAMYRLAYSVTGNDADAQDAVGDAIVKAFEHLHQIKKKDSAKAWLMQIVVNSSKNIIKICYFFYLNTYNMLQHLSWQHYLYNILILELLVLHFLYYIIL